MTTTEAIKNEQATLIDVREPNELDTDGYINNAINIPLRDITTKVIEIKEMSKPIVIFCRSGNRSNSAMQFLQENGVKEVFNGGGLNDVLQILNK